MTDKLARLTACPLCAGTGWVCEVHPDKAWEHDGWGGVGGPCVCNPEAVVPFAEVYAEVPIPDDRLRH